MIKVVGIRFKGNGKMYFFDPLDLDLILGSHAVVETTRGIEYGEVVMEPKEIPNKEIVSPLKNVIRKATEEDDRTYENNIKRAHEAYTICLEIIEKHKLDMKLIDAEYTFDNNKILFYFTAEGRIDFRDLVKSLASIFKTRIELRQVGVRDEAKILGGLGVCGRVLCCHSCLGDFQPVSIKMAKEQGLSLSPTKISGTCGRLMCCLKFEQEAYEDAIKRVPGIGSVVETQEGNGIVVSNNLLREKVKVRMDKGNETDLVEFSIDDVKVITLKSVVANPIDANPELAALEE